MDDLDWLLTDEVVSRSSVAHTLYLGHTATTLVLCTVNAALEDFKHHYSFVTGDSASVMFEFSVSVSSKALKDIDTMCFNAEDKIVRFGVMVRPATGLQILGAAMGAKSGDRVVLLRAEA